MKRKIVEIDRERCDGCGQCVPSCGEGAIALVDGKAVLSDDVLCDGLGACLGECPRGAIRLVEREAAAFDESAVQRRLGRRSHPPRPGARLQVVPAEDGAAGGCPGSRAVTLAPSRAPLALVPPGSGAPAAGTSRLGHWPVQLRLVSTSAPEFRGADVLVAADCVPFAYARFHEDLLRGRRVVVGCPKLDHDARYAQKLAELFRRAGPRSVTVAKMEVPCCSGIAAATRQALATAGTDVPCQVITIGIDGEVR